jgi:phosphoribosylformylglycinamidine synthase
MNKIGSNTPNVKSVTYVKTVFNTIQQLIKDEQIVAGHDVASGGLITTLLEMCFADTNLGAELDLTALNQKDSFKILFAENAGIVFQAKDTSVETILSEVNIEFFNIGKVTESDVLSIINNTDVFTMTVSRLRDMWYKTSYLLDQKQTANDLAQDRFDNFKKQQLQYVFPKHFTGKLADVIASETKQSITNEKITTSQAPRNDNRPKAAILREKGSNSEREMANAMFLAGFDVKDVHMTDLISGRETLEDIQFIGAVGGFSNSDVLGSAKGWAGAFKYNEKANTALKNFFEREDTLSVGICNGAQLWMELDLVNPEHEVHGKLTYNDSQKHESAFTSVKIQENNSVMLSTLAGTTLGVWISHGEGKFNLPYSENKYHIVAKYGYEGYPHNPNGSDFNTAMMCDKTGRHLVTMPHIERSTFQWNWAHYPNGRKDEVSPWLEAFVNARKWIESR